MGEETRVTHKSGYVRAERRDLLKKIRLPLEGSLDLTYRCNNNCLHCWLRIPPGAAEGKEELSFDEIKRIVDEARAMGCRAWNISGGEPMLRPDFAEIFDYITRKAVRYTLNTNGTLITRRIARLLKRTGSKLVALYGATADVHDTVTRNPGSFDAVMRGMAYLKEAGTGFTVQLIPMKANYHQWDKMIELAESLSPHWRCGAAWLYLSASGDRERNREIASQRLSPEEVVNLPRLKSGASTYSPSLVAVAPYHSSPDALRMPLLPPHLTQPSIHNTPSTISRLSHISPSS